MRTFAKMLARKFCLFYPLTLAAVYFEQPQNTTIEESANATFRCSLSNTSFSIFWTVNNSDADFDIFHRRGVAIMPINATVSQLQIVGDKNNNNTFVQCVALLYHNHQIVSIPSKIALLLVLARSVAENDGETLSRRPQTTELSTVPSVTHSSQIMSTLIPMKGSIPKPMWKKQSLILYSCVGAVILISVAVICILLLFIIVRGKKPSGRSRPEGMTDNVLDQDENNYYVIPKKTGGNIECVKLPTDGIKPQTNPAYEHTERMQCHRNIAYEAAVIPRDTQE